MTASRRNGNKKLKLLVNDAFNSTSDPSGVDDVTQLKNETYVYKASSLLNEADDALQFWKQCYWCYPWLAKIAHIDFVACATSTESECMFSTAGLLRNKLASTLYGDHIRAIIKVGSHLHRQCRFDKSNERSPHFDALLSPLSKDLPCKLISH